MTRIPSEKIFGQQFFRYIRDPKRADDVVQSWNFGYVLARLLRGEPLFDNAAVARDALSFVYGSGPTKTAALDGSSMVFSG